MTAGSPATGGTRPRFFVARGIPVGNTPGVLTETTAVPHIASGSRTTRGRMAEMAAANLLAGIRGERLPTPVDPEVYEGR